MAGTGDGKSPGPRSAPVLVLQVLASERVAHVALDCFGPLQGVVRETAQDVSLCSRPRGKTVRRRQMEQAGRQPEVALQHIVVAIVTQTLRDEVPVDLIGPVPTDDGE